MADTPQIQDDPSSQSDQSPNTGEDPPSADDLLPNNADADSLPSPDTSSPTSDEPISLNANADSVSSSETSPPIPEPSLLSYNEQDPADTDPEYSPSFRHSSPINDQADPLPPLWGGPRRQISRRPIKESSGEVFELLGRKILIRQPPPNRRRYESRAETDSSESDVDEKVYPTTEDVLPFLQREAEYSPSTHTWLKLRSQNAHENEKANEILDHIMARVGIEPAKQRILSVHQANGRREEELTSCRSLFTAFIGSSGTGKYFSGQCFIFQRQTEAIICASGQTMISRLYALLLSELAPLSDLVPVEFSGQWLRSDNNLKKALEEIENAKENQGGIYIVSQAHQLESDTSVLQQLLRSTAGTTQNVILIISGDGLELNGIIPQADDSGIDQLQVVSFADYSENEIHRLFVRLLSEDIVEGGPDGSHLRTVASMLAKRKREIASRNMNAILDVIETLKNRRKVREQRQKRQVPEAKTEMPKLDMLTESDMFGEKPGDMLIQSAAWKKLDDMIGLDDVKSAVKAILVQNTTNFYREILGLPPDPVLINRCFLGPPGTGKTTAAKLYAGILLDIGLIKKQMTFKLASDLIGAYVGHSEERMTEAFEEAEGSVLIIDEFHMLYEEGTHDTFRMGVIDTLVGLMQEQTSSNDEGTSVVLIGSTHSMIELFETGNPGLARRFLLENAFKLKNYDMEQLMQIFDLKLSAQCMAVTPDARKAAYNALELARHRPNFGNAGYVESLIVRAKSRHQVQATDTYASTTFSPMDIFNNLLDRISNTVTLDARHIDKDFDRPLHAKARCEKYFESLIGMEDIKGNLIRYQEMVIHLRKRGHDPRPYVPFNFVFSGPPGTGKTTVAKKLGNIFYDMGLLAEADVIECSVSDLLSSLVGETGHKVIRMFERALGKVLFVDEAYRLAEMRATDAVGEIVDCLTKERFYQKVVVILAGYPKDMDRLLSTNRGMRSRFATCFQFRPMSSADGLTLLRQLVKKVDIKIVGLEKSHRVHKLLEKLAATKSWANAREIETLSRMLVELAYKDEVVSGEITIHANKLLSILKEKLLQGNAETKGYKHDSVSIASDTVSVLTEEEDEEDEEDVQELGPNDQSGDGSEEDDETRSFRRTLLTLFPGKDIFEVVDQASEMIGKMPLPKGPDRLMAQSMSRLLQCHKTSEYDENTKSLLAEALEAANQAADATSPGSQLRARAVGLQAMIKSSKAGYAWPDHVETQRLVTEAIDAIKQAQSLSGPMGPLYRKIMNTDMKRMRKKESIVQKVQQEFDETILRYRQALSLSKTDDEDIGRLEKLENIIFLLCRSFYNRGREDPQELDEAIKYGEEWLRLSRTDSTKHWEADQKTDESGREKLSTLFFYRLYFNRYLLNSQQGDLLRALTLFREAEQEKETDTASFWTSFSDIFGYLSILVRCLEMIDDSKVRLDISSDMNIAIHRATQAIRAVTDATTSSEPNLDRVITPLIYLYQRRLEITQEEQHKEEFLEFKVLLYTVSFVDGTHRLKANISLCVALLSRFSVDGNPKDAREALELTLEAQEQFPDSMDAAIAHGYVLLAMCVLQKDPHQLGKAIALLEQKVQLKQDIALSLKGAMHMDTYSVILGLLIQKFELNLDVADADHRIRIVSRFVENNPSRQDMVMDLASAHIDRFRADEKLYASSLDDAIEWCKKALDMPVSQTRKDRDEHDLSDLILLGGTYERRFRATGSLDDREQAISCYRTCYEDDEVEEMKHIDVGFHLAKLLGDRGSWAEASAILVDIVPLVPELASRISDLEDREALLTKFGDLPTFCAAAIMSEADLQQPIVEPSREGFIKKAVEHLEIGRSVITGLALEEAELELLQHRHPDLAKAFRGAREEMHEFAPTLKNHMWLGVRSSRASLPPGYRESKVEAQRHYDQVCSLIRSKEGFEKFLLPPTLDEIQEAAGHGTVIIINFHKTRSDAFMIDRRAVRTIHLDELTYESVLAHIALLRSSYIPIALARLWIAVGKPILEKLGFIDCPAKGKGWPRVWWILTDILAVCPIHAAGVHVPGGTQTVMDRVMSSYSASARLLVHTRRRTRATMHQQTGVVAPQTALLVAMPETPIKEGHKPLAKLPQATREIEIIERTLKSRPGFTTIPLDPKTKDNCLRQLLRCSIFHFAGHGDANVELPSRSQLLLDDWPSEPLTVGDVTRAQARAQARRMASDKDIDATLDEPNSLNTLTTAELPFIAFLSACETVPLRNRKLANEGIHMATGMQLAGFRHVIGTLWPVWDSACVRVASVFYRSLSRTDENGMNGVITDDDVCKALHTAIRAMRRDDYRRILEKWGLAERVSFFHESDFESNSNSGSDERIDMIFERDEDEDEDEDHEDEGVTNQEIEAAELHKTKSAEEEDQLRSQPYSTHTDLKEMDISQDTIRSMHDAARANYTFEIGSSGSDEEDNEKDRTEVTSDVERDGRKRIFDDLCNVSKPIYWASYVQFGV